MAEQGTLHFEIIDKNKQKAHEDKVEMKSELIEFIEKSNSYDLQKMHEQMRKLLKGDKWVINGVMDPSAMRKLQLTECEELKETKF